MNQRNNPHWWKKDYDSAWDRVKAAFKRDWDQTKHDFGGEQPDTDQDVDDTVRQAAGKQPIPPRGAKTYEELENAYRFGYGAKAHYGLSYSNWDTDLEEVLENDWRAAHPYLDWPEYRSEIRRGWDYEEDEGMRRAA